MPVVIGLAVRYGAGEKNIRRVEPFLPLLSGVLLYGIQLGPGSHAAPAISKNLDWLPVVAAVTSLLTIVTWLPRTRWRRLSARQSRAAMFDVGVYNAGLGAVLAGLDFGHWRSCRHC